MKAFLLINRFDHLKEGDPIWARKAMPGDPYGIFIKTTFLGLDLKNEYVITELGKFIHSRIYADLNSNMEYSRKDFVLINHFEFSQWSKDGLHYVTPNNFSKYADYCTWNEFSYPNGMSDEETLQLYLDNGFEKFTPDPKAQIYSLDAKDISKEALQAAKPIITKKPKPDSFELIRYENFYLSHDDLESIKKLSDSVIIHWKSKDTGTCIQLSKNYNQFDVIRKLLDYNIKIESCDLWVCDHCKQPISVDINNSGLLAGFYCNDTAVLIHRMCKEGFYKDKNEGHYGNHNIGLISEMPAAINVLVWGTMRLVDLNNVATKKKPAIKTTNEKGLAALLPVTQKKGLSALLVDSPQQESSDKSVKFIGQFGYNKHNVCVEGEINICEISIDSGKVFCSAEMAQTNIGWAFGYNEGSRFTYSGSGGSCRGIDLHSKEQYSTKEECATAAFYCLISKMIHHSRKAPADAATKFNKAVKLLQTQKGDKPKPYHISAGLEKNGPKEIAPVKVVATKAENKQPGKPVIKKQDPRTDLIKFRASHHTRLMASKIAIAKGMNLSDMLHYAMKDLGQDILTQAELEGII